ncbi:YdhK family protein [Corynebacterium sanguinis]|uniref:YdhK family protein n=1 Tax=Corynebacterium sanguinis TaxID=2594913 RepID=UPI00223A922F|nr:YdhK family protein [Corynebacterium sanguinis]MCT1426834.1 YdhK family protein [Corynebacterium sanguinis]MCT1629473.1 YdhK family protein [Corynebacterium sanguinis]
MKRTIAFAPLTLTSALALSACGEANNADTTDTTTTATATQTTTDTAASTTDEEHGGHDHPADGGAPPAGIEEAEDPTYPVGTEVILTADHMPGMDGATATISGAFDTTTYSVSYTPTEGGAPVTDHRWVVHEELVDPGQAPLPDGASVVLDAEHMSGMKGAEATIDYSTEETVYMVDLTVDGMTMTNHKWVTESEIQPAP